MPEWPCEFRVLAPALEPIPGLSFTEAAASLSAGSFSVLSRGTGWRAQRHGYLAETEVLSSLAIFCTLTDLSWREAVPHLDPHLPPLLKRVVDDLKPLEDELHEMRGSDS